MVRIHIHVTVSMALLVLGGVLVRDASADDLRRRGMMGVNLSPVHEDAKEKLKLDAAKGVVVTSVVPDSAAAAAGVAANDVIRKIGPDAVDDLPALFSTMRKYYGGDTLKLTVLREGAEKIIELTLKPRPKENPTDFEILYDSAGEPGKRVRTLVTKPPSEGKRPAVLIITGILGSISVEQSFPGHPIKSLIQELNKAGYVTMRVERPGLGDSDGTDLQATTVAADVASFRAALAKLQTYDFVDGNKVFLFGHGMGTVIAPMIAKDQKLAGVITFGAAFRSWPESAVEAMRLRWKLELVKEDELKTKNDALKGFFEQYISKKQAPADILAKAPDLAQALGEGVVEGGFVFHMPAKYGQELAESRPADVWPSVKAPVLAIWGEADYISGRADSEQLAESVNKGQPGKAAFLPLAEVDHMMFKAADQEESFLAGMGTFSPKFVETITKWMAEKSKQGT